MRILSPLSVKGPAFKGPALALLLLGGAAQAQDATPCAASITRIPAVVFTGAGEGYDPFDPRVYVEEGSVDLRNDGDSPCALELTFVGAQSERRELKGPASILDFEITESPGSADNLPTGPDRVSARGLRVMLGPQQVRSVPFFVRIPAGQGARPGIHTGELLVSIVSAETGSPMVLDDEVLTVSAELPSRAEVNLAGVRGLFEAGVGSYVMDFNELTEDAERSIFVQVRSTGGYSLSISSENGGFLAHENKALPDRVAYTATLGGMSVTFAGAAASPVLQATNPTNAAGMSYPFTVKIGRITNQLAGKYQDTVTITVDPAG
ncbi:hypothetical protein [Zavarzinia sp. CC-PAN008]|uniref:hypothetical protein n=1 Tax=Zavarzinia sp. CC-PAN008 TaxID=3243332 RepID=UPI003F7437E2